ncbi:MAG: hypothetical protein Q7I99_05210 [Acholeplasmataceae bacterium]|nr:hypothetical protein [Acholeplasmataceae bacterium]
MKRYRRNIFLLDTIFVILMISQVIMYGHLVGFYMEHTLFIVFIFVIIITASIYVHDVIRQMLHRRIKGLRVKILSLEKEMLFPKTICINEIRKKNHQLVYRYQGYNIPICFVERVDNEKAYLYPSIEGKAVLDNLYEIVANYKYKFFLVKDTHEKKYIIDKEQVLSIE